MALPYVCVCVVYGVCVVVGCEHKKQMSSGVKPRSLTLVASIVYPTEPPH